MTEALSPTPWLIGVVTALVAFFALDLWRLIAEAQSRVGAHDRRMRLGAAGVVGAWVALTLFATFVPGVRDWITSVPGLPAILLAALVGGVASQVTFSGLSPQFVGVNQINIVLAARTPTGNAVPVQIQVNGSTNSNLVTIAVSQ